MTTASTLSAKDLRVVIDTFAELLLTHKEVINRLNVYPVPDGDTGTNMTLTMQSVSTALGALAPDATLGEVAAAVAHGSLMGARGNSGVILCQLLRGLVASFPTEGHVGPTAFAEALVRADALARHAVVRPVEGTILSVARAGALGATGHDDSFVALVHGARDAAVTALAKTPDQLEVLKRAGVVDSGGTGLVLFFDALCNVFAGDPLPVAPPLESIDVPVFEVTGESTVADLRYEVMYLLEGDDTKMPAFREVWSGLGDSIVIVGDNGLYNCHIHTDNVGGAIEASLDVGRPREIRVTDLAGQVLEESWVRDAHREPPPEDTVAPPRTSVVAVVVGEGVGRIFRSLGVRQLVLGGQSMNPSTADLVDAVLASGSSDVVILPNNDNVLPVAAQVAALVERNVAVVATTSIVGGFAALLAYDPDESADQNARAMTAAACHVVAGEVTRAVRDSPTDIGPVSAGDWIGLGPGGVVSIADSLVGASTLLLSSLVQPDHELVTIIEGDGASGASTRLLTDFLADAWPALTVEVHHGGQPLYPYYFGLE